tara:strand:- start:1368 stop:1829 length:462 start_codon:yes stop_codon:yes gene_type:complete
MVALYGGQETIPGQVDHPVPLTVEEVNISTQQGFGPSPAETAILQAEIARQKAEDAERARLAEMERQARQAGEEYYAEGGTGYGTVPGGPDVTYMPSDAPLLPQILYTGLDPYYGTGGPLAPVTDLVTGEGDARQNLLLYGALAIGALALLKR